MRKITTAPPGVRRKESEIDWMSNIYITIDSGKEFVIYVRDEGIIIRETTGEDIAVYPSSANTISIK